MAEQFYTILTTVGQNKIADAIANNRTINLSTVAVGDGGGSYYDPSPSQTSLRNERWRGGISELTIDPNNSNWVIVKAVIPYNIGGFYIREVGVFDMAGDLIAIGKVPETYKPTFTDNNTSKDLVIRIILQVANASVVELSVNPSTIIATVDMLNQKANVDLSNVSDTNILNKIKNVDGSGSGLDADTVDTYHASQTPSPNTIPVAKSDGKIDADWLPPINAQSLNNYNASQTPAPNTIPVSNNTGKLALDWIPQGAGSGLNADLLDGIDSAQFVRTDSATTITAVHQFNPSTAGSPFTLGPNAVNQLITGLNADLLDGYNASQTPAPNTIPVAGADGKLAPDWLPTTSSSSSSGTYEAYSTLTIGTSFPTTPNHNDLFWNSSQLKLYKYNVLSTSWVEIDWKTIVKASPEFVLGRLRINSSTNQLEISPDGTNWYACIPALGSPVIRITTVDNTSYSYLYWIPPGQTVVIQNANHIPIVYAKNVQPVFEGYMYHTNSGLNAIGLRPNNTAISNGALNYIYTAGSTVHGYLASSFSFVPIKSINNTTIDFGWFTLMVRSDNLFLSNGIGWVSNQDASTSLLTGKGTASATAYWLGTWWKDTSSSPAQITISQLTLVRRS